MSAAAVLTIMRDGETLKSCPLEGEMVLGRAEGCVIRLEDRAISRQHAVFRTLSDGVQVEKKSEFAPLKVNGAECTSALLREGDVIAIGPYLMALSFKKQQESGELPRRAEESPKNEAHGEAEVVPLGVEVGSEAIASPAENPEGEAGGEPLIPDNDAVGGLQELPEEEPHGLTGGIILAGMERASADSQYVEEDGKTKVGAPEKVQARLIFSEGAANVTEFSFDDQPEISIGRGKSCDIILNDKKSSRKNTIIKRAGVQFIIKDLGSSNGTYVNDERIDEQELSGDDRIRIGDVEFQFKVLSADYVAGEKNFLPVEDHSEDDFDDVNVVLDSPDFQIALPADAPQLDMAAAAPIPGAIPSPQPFDPNAAIPGIAGIPGVEVPGKPQPKSLIGKGLAKLNAMPPLRRTVWMIIIIGGIAWLLFDDETIPVKRKPKPKPSVVATMPSGTPASPGVPRDQQVAFEALTPEQRKFVEDTHHLAFEYFKNQDFDKALFELGKIFALVSDYKDAKDIERYAKEGKRRLEAKEEEQRRKAEEIRMKAKIEELENQARERMAKKQYDQAREIFPQIHLLDPENALVQKWSEEIEQAEQEKRIAQQREEARKERNKDAWKAFNEGVRAKKKGRYHSAIAIFSKIKEFEATDPKLEKMTRLMIARCLAAIKAVRDPLLAQGKQLEEAGDFAKAYEAYHKAAKVDPMSPEAQAGMNRARGVLHDRAKILYTEAVLAESYSDFTTAKKKFHDILQTTPKDDLYYERAERKQRRYFKLEDGGQSP